MSVITLVLGPEAQIENTDQNVCMSFGQESLCKQKLSNEMLLFSLEDADATFTSHLLSISLWHLKFITATN